MLTISTNSWHYRLLKWLRYSRPDNLCAYFWKVVWALLSLPGAGCLMLIGIILLSTPLWWWYTDWHPFTPIVMGLFEIVILGKTLYEVVKARHRQEIYDGTRPRPVPKDYPRVSLLKEWLRARHRNICPFLEFQRPVNKDE